MSDPKSTLSKTAFYFKNTAHTTENIITIAGVYLFNGLNCLISGFLLFKTDKTAKTCFIAMGIILIAVALLSIVERRPQMTGTGYVIVVFMIHWTFCVVFSFVVSWPWVFVYLFEAILLCSIIVFSVYRKTR